MPLSCAGALVVRLEEVRDLRVQLGTQGYPATVQITMAAPGAAAWAAWTSAHVGDQVAVVVDDQVLMAPVVNEAIPNGAVALVGGDGPGEAHALYDRLVGR